MSGSEQPEAEQRRVDLEQIRAAETRLAGHLIRTPLIEPDRLGAATGTRLHLKLESLQRTGSFKARGALNAVLAGDSEVRERGVVTFSAGNHGLALAWAAHRLNAACHVFMSAAADARKVASIRAWGGSVVQRPTMGEAIEAMHQHVETFGSMIVAPFGDPLVMSGQGTVGLEIIAEQPDVQQVIVPVGGGGLIAGMATAIDALAPSVRIVGVEPVGAPTVSRALEAGCPVELECIDTFADGLAAPFTSDATLDVIARLVDDIVLVSDAEIEQAMTTLVLDAKLASEPAGAAAVAALLSGKAAVPAGDLTIAVVSGANVSIDRFTRAIAAGAPVSPC